MSRSFIHIIFLVLLPLLTVAQWPAERCGTDYYSEKKLEQYPERLLKKQEIEAFTRRWIAENEGKVERREPITIPVVVHIVWHKEEENITEEQVFSQIEVLNKDFRRDNIEKDGLPAEFAAVAADSEIQFCLATVDPDGNPTNGITRTQTDFKTIAAEGAPGDRDRIKHSEYGGKSAWDTDQYLNIWVGNFGPGLLGYACFPGDCSPEEDGVVVDPKAFGTLGMAAANSPNHLGRTTTHEVGHYFNLRHLWGSRVGSCSNDDEVEDTPRQFFNSEGCPTHPKVTCGTADMFMNYMDYTDDACMGMFSAGQKLRMLAAVEGPRSGLLSSAGCGTIVPVKNALEQQMVQIYPNPADAWITIDLKWISAEPVEISINNLFGQQLALMQSNTGSPVNIPTAHLPRGVYIININADQGSLSRKVVITH